MAIDVSQIHNLVRTYQRALRDSPQFHQEAPKQHAHSREDRVSLSTEARERVDQSQSPDKKA